MKTYYMGDDEHKNETDETPEIITRTWLDKKVRSMDVSASVEHRHSDSIIKVMDHQGSSQYLANGGLDLIWLQHTAEKFERHGSVTWYFIKRDE